MLEGYSWSDRGMHVQYNAKHFVKIFDKAIVAEQEAHQMIAANNINSLSVKFLDLTSVDGVYYLYMEKIESLSREQIREQLSMIVVEDMIEIFKAQLKELHDKSIYHIDLLNPYGRFDNILITSTGVRLIDWGRSPELENHNMRFTHPKVWESFCREIHQKEWKDFHAFCEYFKDML